MNNAPSDQNFETPAGSSLPSKTSKSEDKNPFGLSPDELKVLAKWAKGMSMSDAYSDVMLSVYDKKSIREAALKTRVNRFFDTWRMREAMANVGGERGEVGRRAFERWKINHRGESIKKWAGEEGVVAAKILMEAAQDKQEDLLEGEGADVPEDFKANPRKKSAKRVNLEKRIKGEMEHQRQLMEEEYEEKYQDRVARDKEKWINSLNINVNPDSMTVYGTGQFLAYVAVKEIFARQNAIKASGKSVLDKDGSALTPVIISALKTAAAMILPFAPSPTAEDRKQMSKAAVLLGLMPDDITEDPDDYTAPAPVPIDVGDN